MVFDPLASHPVPVAEIERTTGLSKEVIRKWEIRYGFPIPGRDGNGERLYPADQVLRLRLVSRLLDAGRRPSQVVSLPLDDLEALVAKVSLAGAYDLGDFQTHIFRALKDHDPVRLAFLLQGQLRRQGPSLLARETIPQLNVLVGEAWLRGDLRVFEEHLYAQAIQDLLQGMVAAISSGPSGTPRILLATPPGEIHVLGLMSARVVLTLNGAECVMLGAQVPVVELVAAAQSMKIDVVGLSFSIAQPVRLIGRVLSELRAALPGHIHVWAGGMGVARMTRPLPGVAILPTLNQAIEVLETLQRSES